MKIYPQVDDDDHPLATNRPIKHQYCWVFLQSNLVVVHKLTSDINRHSSGKLQWRSECTFIGTGDAIFVHWCCIRFPEHPKVPKTVINNNHVRLFFSVV